MKVNLYHGSNSVFDSFDMNKYGVNGGKQGYLYFTNNKENAAFYGSNTATVELTYNNPLLFNDVPVWYAIEQYEKQGLSDKFDCIIVKGIIDGLVMSDIYVITDPSKVKILNWESVNMTESRNQFIGFINKFVDVETRTIIMEGYDVVYSEFDDLIQQYTELMDKNRGNNIKGGLGDKRYPESVNRSQLEKGIKIEMEHTDDPMIAIEIAIDHLVEISDYYDRLEEMEKEVENK